MLCRTSLFSSGSVDKESACPSHCGGTEGLPTHRTSGLTRAKCTQSRKGPASLVPGSSPAGTLGTRAWHVVATSCDFRTKNSSLASSGQGGFLALLTFGAAHCRAVGVGGLFWAGPCAHCTPGLSPRDRTGSTVPANQKRLRTPTRVSGRQSCSLRRTLGGDHEITSCPHVAGHSSLTRTETEPREMRLCLPAGPSTPSHQVRLRVGTVTSAFPLQPVSWQAPPTQREEQGKASGWQRGSLQVGGSSPHPLPQAQPRASAQL